MLQFSNTKARRGLVVLLVVAAAGLAGAVRASAAMPCWQRLVHDWSDGAIDRTYPIPCYGEALARMPEDLRLYSSAPDDIRAALHDRVQTAGERDQDGRRELSLATTGSQKPPTSGGTPQAGSGVSAGALTTAAIVAGLALVSGLALAVVSALFRRAMDLPAIARARPR